MTRLHTFPGQLDGRAVEMRIHEPSYVGQVEHAKRFKVIVFDAEDKVLAVRTRKTIDLPGGRIEWEDDTLADAARREVREMAAVTLGPLAVAAVMVATPVDQSEAPCSSIIVVTSRATLVSVPRATLHIHRYAFLKPPELLKRYNAGPQQQLHTLTEMAQFVVPEAAERGERRCGSR